MKKKNFMNKIKNSEKLAFNENLQLLSSYELLRIIPQQIFVFYWQSLIFLLALVRVSSKNISARFSSWLESMVQLKIEAAK